MLEEPVAGWFFVYSQDTRKENKLRNNNEYKAKFGWFSGEDRLYRIRYPIVSVEMQAT